MYPVLVKHWLVLPLGEMKVRDSCPGRKLPGGPGMKGERFARKPAHVAPSLSSLFNRLAELMLGNSLYSRASQWQDFGVEVLHRNGLNRMKTPHGGHDHQQWPLFSLRTNSASNSLLVRKPQRQERQQDMSRARKGKTSSPSPTPFLP